MKILKEAKMHLVTHNDLKFVRYGEYDWYQRMSDGSEHYITAELRQELEAAFNAEVRPLTVTAIQVKAYETVHFTDRHPALLINPGVWQDSLAADPLLLQEAYDSFLAKAKQVLSDSPYKIRNYLLLENKKHLVAEQHFVYLLLRKFAASTNGLRDNLLEEYNQCLCTMLDLINQAEASMKTRECTESDINADIETIS